MKDLTKEQVIKDLLEFLHGDDVLTEFFCHMEELGHDTNKVNDFLKELEK